MPPLRSRLARPLVPLLALALVAVSCGRELTGPVGGRRAAVALTPDFGAMRLDGSGEVLSVTSLVPFTRVRVVLLRANGDTAVDRMVDFPADADSVSLSFPVTLSPAAPAEGEPLGAVMKYVNAAGDTVFASPTVPVQARTATAGAPPVVTIPLTYVGPGSTATSLVLTPDSVVGVRNKTVTFTAVARNAQGATLPNTPVAFTSTDTTLVRVGLGSGAATLVGVRGSALVIAQTLTGQRDTSRVTILPTPTGIAVVSGNNQQVRQAGGFPQPLRVRVTAADGLGVAGADVAFAVTAGRGTVSAATVRTDTAGFAQVAWTAGDTAMVGTVVASVTGQPTLSTAFSGTQLSSGPTSLVIAAQPPATVVTGDTLTSIKVMVLDATLDTVRAFAGAVTLTLTGGPAGASLLGTATVNAVAGVARFPGLHVNRAGTGYRLVAQLPAAPAVPSVQSTPFTATPAPPALVQLLTGSGQVTPGGTAFTDSIRVWVKDRFDIGVAGATVTFSVVSGNGSVSPASIATNASGIAAARWTAGVSGPQAVDVIVAGVAPVRVVGSVPSAISLTSGAGQAARFGEPFPQPVIFTVLGDSGRVLAGVPVAFSATGGGTLSPTSVFSDAQGLVRVTWTAGTIAGQATLTATIPGTDKVATAVNTQASPGPTSAAFSTEPVTIAAGDTLPAIRVRVMDGLATTIPTFTGRVTLSLVGGTAGAALSGPSLAVNAVGGIATFSGLTVTRAGTGYQLRASVDGTPVTALSTAFAVTSAAPATMTLLAGANQSATGGSTLPTPITVEVRDAFGFGVAGATVTFTASSGGGTVAPASAVTDSLGRASTSWTVGSAGLQRLTIGTGALTPLTVAATIPQGLALVSGGGQAALFGTLFATPITFRVTGDGGTPMAGIPVAFGVTGGGVLSQVRDTSDATGLVSVSWTAGTVAGVATLTATIPGMSLTAAASGQQASPAPTTLTLTGAPTQVVAGDSMPTIQVRVLDGLGNPVTSYTAGVRLALAGGTAGAQLLGTALRQATAGIASFPGLSIDRAGSGYRLVATLDPAQAGLQTNSDTIRVTPAPPTALQLVSGGGQSAPELLPLPDSVVVRVVDRFGFGVPGVTVAFTVVTGGGSLSSASVVTSSGATPGRAAVRWTVGPVGAQQLKIAVGGLPDLTVNATSIPTGGPPVLFIAQEDGLQLRTGQPQLVTLFLSSPSPTPVTVNLSTTASGVVMWEVPSLEIPAGASQIITELLPTGVGSAFATVSSSAGTDSLLVYVDSAAIGFRIGTIDASVGDTIRTQVLLDAPAPFGGVTATITSADPATLLVAAGSGRGLSEEPTNCYACESLRAPGDTTPRVLGTPGATATVQIRAGQMAGEVILLPIAAAAAWQEVALTVTAPGRTVGGSSVFVSRASLQGYAWSNEAPVGHHLLGAISLNAPFRREVRATVRSLDPAVVVPVDSIIPIEALTNGRSGIVLGRAVGLGTGRLVVEAPGFGADTVPVTVIDRSLSLETFGPTGLRVDQVVTATARLGGRSNGFFLSSGDTPPATGVPVTFTAMDTTVLRVVTPTVLAEGFPAIEVRLRGVGTGTTGIIASAPGYGADTLFFLVGGSTPSLGVFGPLTSGLVGSLLLTWESYGAALAAPTDFTITTADTAVIGVLTPSVRIAAGASSATVRLEGRAPGSTTVTITAPGVTALTTPIAVVAPMTLASIFAPFDALVRPEPHSLSVYLDGEAATRQVFRVRSTDPTVAQVLDSVLTIPAGATWAAPRFRALAEGQAQFILSTIAGADVDTSAVTLVNRPTLVVFGNGLINGRVPIGRGTRVPLQAYVPEQPSTGITVTARGPLGTTVIAADSLPLDEYGSQPFVLVGPSNLPASGTDTVTVARAGALSTTFLVEAATIVPTILVGPVGLGVAAEVDAYLGLQSPATQIGVIAPPAPMTFRLVSLDTTRLRVEQDTVRLTPDGVAGARTGVVRAIGAGSAQLVLQPLAGTSGVGADTTTVYIDRARLFSPFFPGESFAIGMQQRSVVDTTNGGAYAELYIERSTASRKPLWVRLRSSAPSIASVPDSVLIPGDSSYANLVVTGGDSVGTVRITATAAQHIDATFDVRVQRTSLAPYTPFTGDADLTTGGRTTLDVYALSTDIFSGGPQPVLRAADAPTADLLSPLGGTARPSTVPIPVRLAITDTTVLAAAVRDTATIPAGGVMVRMPGIIGKQPGRTAARIEDRRATTFARLAPAEGVVEVVQARLVFGSAPLVSVPFLGETAPGFRPSLASSASADSVLVQVTSRTQRTGLDVPSIPLVASDSMQGGLYNEVYLPLRGLALGIDTLIATAPGHRPDTLIVTVTGGAIDLVESATLPASLHVGDSTLVSLGLRDATGAAVTAITPITLNLALSPTLTTSGGVQSVTLQPGMLSVDVWLKGVSAGPATLTVTTPNFATFRAALTVRTP